MNEKQLLSMLKRVEKPARYIGNELNLIVKEDPDVRFLFAFPDLYEIGMSYVGLEILYKVINDCEGISCERMFAPAPDMEKLMREENVPLFSLETKTPAKDFDMIGFTLQYEMSFTNILNMLDLAGIPLHAADRTDDDPIICAGGPCAYNPEPLCDFFDFFTIGDGEESMPELLELRKTKRTRREFLEAAAHVRGTYVPEFYDVKYKRDGTISSYTKNNPNAPDKVTRCLIGDIDPITYPTEPIVPLIEVVHDRAVVETFRGCTRGCRFCQAGMIYRPVRERKTDTIRTLAKEQLRSSGHDELSLLSLSTSDYSDFEELAIGLMRDCKEHDVSLSLPSLRLDSFNFKVLDEIQGYRKSALTFAPEAGTQRLRDVINKNVTEDDIYGAIEQAIELGWKRVKLYFMIGLPGEREEDLDGIAEIASRIMEIYKNSGKKGRFKVSISLANFVPKPFTPFQWAPQNSSEVFIEKHNYLSSRMKIKGVEFNYHDSPVSHIEAVIARGDRKQGALIEAAWRGGCKFDSWNEYFNEEAWKKAFEETGISPEFYAERVRSYDEIMPWDIIDAGISKRFLISENEKASNEETTQDCRLGCTGCGINRLTRCALGGSLKKPGDQADKPSDYMDKPGDHTDKEEL